MVGISRGGSCLVAMVAATVLAAPASAQQHSFDIPAQPLADALTNYSRQAGVQIFFPTAAIAGRQSVALKGRMDAGAALRRLIAGSGLGIASETAKVVALRVEQGADASAQADDAGGSGEEIIVTGQRRLSRAPQDAKKSSLGFVDSIGALEIQKQTDTTLVDVLRRLPGVSMQRGFQFQKGWYVVIRGLDGNYSSVDLDGGTFLDTGRNDRATTLDTIPANAINEVIVHKTVTPDMDGNSIAGHISVNTLRSFDLNGAPVTKGDLALNLYEQNGAPKGHAPGKAGNLVVKRTFGQGGDFGFVGAASFHDDRYSQVYNNTSSYIVSNGIDIPTSSIQRGNFDIHDKGVSLLGKFEARSGSDFYGFAEATYFNSDIFQDNYRGGITLNGATIRNATEGKGRFTGAAAQAYSRTYAISRDLWSFTTGGEYKLSDDSKIRLVGSMLRSKRLEETRNGAFYSFGGLSGSYDIQPNVVDITLDPVAGLSDPARWSANPSTAATFSHLPQRDHVYTGRLDYTLNSFPFSQGVGLSVGIAGRRLSRDFKQSADNYTLPAGTQYTLDSVLIDGGRGSAFDGKGIVYVDRAKYWTFLEQNGVNRPTTTPTSSYDLTEDVIAGYGAVHYNSDKIHALAGGRYEKTIVDDATARLDVNGVPQPFSFHRSYGYFLPNVQASYDVLENLRFKAAYTQAIARPAFTTFAQGLTINNFSGVNVFFRGSNPDLKPRRSRNYDLSIESYATHGYVSIGAFQKDITDEIYFLTTTEIDPVTKLTIGRSIPYNASNSKLRGLELSAEWRDFSGLAPWLNGLTLRGNASRLWGKLDVLDTTGQRRTIDGLNQQPHYLLNATAVYDTGPFTGTIAYEKRGRAFNGGVGATAAGDTYTDGYDGLDARVAVRPVAHLEVFLSARNLTNSWWRETTGVDRAQLGTAIQSGRSFTAGAQFRF